MTLILQWGQRVLGRGEGESLWVRLLLLQNFPTRLDSFLLSLIRLVTGANNSALVVVSAALSFTNSSRTPFLVVASATRASKYSSRSDADLVRPFACWTWGACLSAPCTAPNWSWHATAFFWPWHSGQLPCTDSSKRPNPFHVYWYPPSFRQIRGDNPMTAWH